MAKQELIPALRSIVIRAKSLRWTIAGALLVAMVLSTIMLVSGANADSGASGHQRLLLIPSAFSAQSEGTEPTHLTAELVAGGVLLNWDAPAEDASSVTGYEILRRHPGNGEHELSTLVADSESTNTSYTDATATEPGTRYIYVVKALRGSQKSGGSNHGFADVPEYTCEGGGYNPTPVEVEVTAVPIVVQSTADHYFVLYAQQQLTVLVEEVPLWMTDGEEDRATSVVDLPVSVTLGQAGTTQLEERVADLPAERYRVERYLISDPADVDRDCFDDISELADPVGRNPVNPAAAIELSVGALVVPDRETFEELSRRRSGAELYYQPDQYPSSNLIEYTKFVLFNMETDRPGVYFMNTSAGMEHRALMEATGLEWNNTIRGELFFHPELVAPDGSRGVYSYRLVPFNSDYSFDLMNRAFTHLAASLPLVDGNFALHLRNPELPYLQDLLPLYRDSRIDLVFDEDVFAETSFQALNPGEGYGLLRLREPDERPLPRDIVIYDALPNNLPRVAGIISTTPQTPLSHVNLRATQDELPNAFIRDALDDADIQSLIGSYVHYTVTEDGWTLRPASPKQVEAYYASSRPSQDHVPERDLSVTSITPLSEIGFEDWDAFGVKAANLAVLRSLDFPYPPATVPDGFAVPFNFYDEFMKANGFYDDIRDMLADPDFQSDFDVQQDELKKLRKKIKKGDTPGWINAALVEMHAAYPEGTSLRYRSSTNNEDLPGFNGAGLYDSKTQHPEETEEDGISKSLKQVYASLWNFRAFAEREFHRVDHLTTAMGVLVHPNYSNELANGVAVSFNPMFRTLEWYYVNTQVGEDLVTNPEALSVPEELLLRPHGENEVLATSNLLPPGKLLLSESQRAQLHGSLAVIHNRFKALYNPEPDEPFAMEIEFKITSDNVLSIKQARPWVFNVAIPPSDNIFATGRPIITGTTQVGETLTSDVSGIADEDGLDNAPLSYQWVSNGGTADTDITDAVALTYTVSEDVVGRSIRVRVSFTDDAGYRETLVSQRTDAVQARPNHLATGLPAISGEPQVGEALSVDVSGIDDADGLTNPTFSYHWVSNHGSTETDIEGATEAAYILVSDDAGKTVKVRVTFTDDAGNEEILTSAATALIGDVVEEVVWESELRAGRVTNFFPEQSGYSIYGNLGEILSPNTFVIDGTNYRVLFLTHASESLWLGTEGELPSDFTLRVGDSTYLGSDSMAPHVSGGVSGYWWSSVAPGWFTDDPAQVSLSVHPDVPLESRLKAPVTGYFRDIPADHDGNEDISFRVYFSEGVATTADALRDHVLAVSGGEVSSVEAIGSEGSIWAVSVTPESHHPVAVGIEADLDCQSSAAICTGDGRRLFNRMELTVEPREKNPATGAPTISGTVEPGQTLTADTSGIADADGLTGATFTYQWVSYDGNADADIQGATDSTYTLVPADAGKAFRVRVLFTDDAGNSHSLTSPLARSDRPYGLNASESDGAVVLTWRLPAGWTGSTFQILRNRPELGETEPQVHVRYIQTAANTYTDADVEPGVQYVYRVKGVDPFGYTGEASHPFEIRTEDTGAAPARPNVVIILADDLGWGDIQTNNPDSAMTTPRIDSIAAAGANFADAHSPSSACTGTRYGLLTGRYSWRSWLSGGVLNAYDRPLIGPDRPTLGTLLQGHGYRTAAIGKWHLGMNFTRLSDINGVNFINRGIDFDAEIVDGPIDHGFDEFFGTGGNLSWSFPPVYIRDDRFTAVPKAIGPIVFGNIEFDEVLDRLTEEAVAFIEREGQTDEPFFLYMPLNAPHGPLAPNDDFLGSTDLGRYGDFVAQVDWSVGQVLDTLRRVGEYDNTMVIFTSDNGSNMNRLPNHVSVDHTQDPDVLAYYVGTHQSNGEWKHGKGSIYEGGHRMPFLLQWPAAVEAGSAVDATVSLTDLYATLADILGQNPGPGEATDSVSLLPLLSGEAVTRGAPVVHHSGEGEFAIRDGRWKLVFHEPRELYDLEQDPVEQDNLAAANPEVVARLEASLARIRTIEDGTLSGDATLRDLRLVGIDIGEFAPDALTYTAIVGREIETVEVMAIPTGTDARASISTPEGRLLYGKPRRGRTEVELAYPTTTIVVNVVSPDTSAATTYTATVTRSEAKIGGTAMVGETLTADTLGITDPDGLTGATFSYQWTRHDGSTDSDIVGATSPTYVLATEDEGKSVLVRVSFIDDVGNAETQTSPPTPEVEAGLTAQFQSVPEKHEGSTPFVFRVLFSEPVEASYQTLEEHSFEVSNGTIVEARRVDGRNVLWEIEIQPRTHAAVVITLPPTADCADTGAVCASNGKRLFTRLEITVAPPANSPPQGMPTVSGAVEVGETLAADTSGIADADGLTGATFTYQWVSYDGNADTDIPGATSSTYTLVPANEGKAFKVRVSFTDDAGFEESLVSALARSDRPYGLNASESDGAVVLTWRLPAGWTGSTFQILRNRPELGETEPQVHVRYIQTAANTYTDADVEPGVQYVYRVKGVDPFGYLGPASAPVELRMPPDEGANNPASGVPTVTGTVQVGEALTADTSSIADADGLSNVAYSYQWIGNDGTADADIQGATSSTYTLITADAGKTIKLRVSFTDDEDNEETLTSAATAAVAARPNTPGTGSPSIRGVLEDEQELTADTVSVADADGLTNATISYQWIRVDDGTPSDITGQTASTYTLTANDVGKSIQLQVSFTDDRGTAESLTGAVTNAVVASGATRKLLWLSTITVEDHDNLGMVFGFDSSLNEGSLSPAAFTEGGITYSVTFLGTSFLSATTLAIEMTSLPTTERTAAWRLVLHDTELALAHATTTETNTDPPSYRFEWDATALSINDRDLWDDGDAFTVSLQEAVNLSATGLPTIGGTAQVGETLTVSTSDIADDNGLTNVSFSYQWIAGGSDINGATGSSHALTASQQGQTIQVRVSFTDDDGFSESVTSEATAAVAAASVAANHAATGLPTIGGTVQVGETLTVSTSDIADEDGLDDVTYTYQWIAGGSDINGATGSSHTLTASQQSQTIQVRVSFTDDDGFSESVTSEATTAVAAKPPLLTASFSNVPANHNGSSTFTFDLAFSENIQVSFRTIRDEAFTASGGSIAKAQRKTQGSNQNWTITVQPNGNGAISITLPQTTDCDDTGAICAPDGRMLSTENSITVVGQ